MLTKILLPETRRASLNLQSSVEKEVKAYALERNLRKARADAETAWRKKDYLAVVKALKPLRAALTATEIGKLEFAEKQIGSK